MPAFAKRLPVKRRWRKTFDAVSAPAFSSRTASRKGTRAFMPRVRVPPPSRDPTKTGAIRRQLLTDIQQRLGRLKQMTQKAIIDQDTLGLGPIPTMGSIAFTAHLSLAVQLPQRMQFDPDHRKIAAWDAWFTEAAQHIVVDRGGYWLAPYVSRAYSQGINAARYEFRLSDANPYHVKSGPQGGQFTTGPSSGGGTKKKKEPPAYGGVTESGTRRGYRDQAEQFAQKSLLKEDFFHATSNKKEILSSGFEAREDDSNDHPGISFARTKEAATAIVGHGEVLVVKLFVSNPVEFGDPKVVEETGEDHPTPGEFSEAAERLGHDAVISKGEIRVFSPKQIFIIKGDRPSWAPKDSDRMAAIISLMQVELQGAVDAMVHNASRAMASGLLAGSSKSAIFKLISAQIDAIGRVRLRAMANTYIVRAFNEAKLDVYEDMGVQQVGIIAETHPPDHSHDHATDAKSKRPKIRKRKPKQRRFKTKPDPREQGLIERREARLAKLGLVNVLTAGDDKVCFKCEGIAEEGPYDIDTARGLIPAHPNCRCAFIPADERDDDD